MKRIISLLLGCAMIISICTGMTLTSFAAEGTISAEAQGTYTKSAETQDITIRLNISGVTESYCGFIIDSVNVPQGFTIKSYSTSNASQPISKGNYNVENGALTYDETDTEDTIPSDTYYELVITAPANASGDYVVEFLGVEVVAVYGTVKLAQAETVSATLTIKEPTIQGYTAGLTTLDTAVAKNGTVTVNVGVDHSSDSFFNAAELEINYDHTKLSVESVVSEALSQEELKYTDNNGKLKIEEFGEDKNFSTSNYTITFTAIETGEAFVTLTSAKFVHKDNADKSDLISATLDKATVNITISQEMFQVTLPNDGNITGNSTAGAGDDYTFTASEYENYAYTVTVKVNGTQIADNKVTDNGDGTYTIDGSAVTGNIEITYTREGRSYNVSWSGNGAEFVETKPTTATYGEAFNFTLPDDKTATDDEDGFYYTLEVRINGTKYTGYDVEEGTRNYTIPGTDITGAIVITVTKTATSTEKFTVTTDGTAAGDATVNQSLVVKFGEASITVTPEAGYQYEVTATMGGETVTVTASNNTYTVVNVEGNVVFTVNKSLITTGVNVTKYVTLDGMGMFLVTYDITLASGKVPTYNGNAMFYSEKYGTYCWLVIADTLTVENAKTMIGAKTGTATNVRYSMDINCTGIIDAADAQFVWNMYEAEYSDFTTATMAQFLAADQNWDAHLDVNDALTIVSAILQGTAQ